jgi:polyhydroxybutyrate depolymerase
MTKKRLLMFGLLLPLTCILCLLLVLAALFVQNRLRWRDDLRQIASPGDYELSLDHDGRARTYLLHVPLAYNEEDEPLPLVIALHGANGNADIMRRMTGFDSKADAEGFIVVYPNGTGPLPNWILTWNADRCCGYAVRRNADDIGFLRALIESLSGELAVDPNRVYMTGISNGGMMSLAAACEIPDLLAAVGPVVGAMLWFPCEPARPVSTIMINGTADRVVPYDGGFLSRPRGIDDSAAGAVSFWTNQNGCGDASRSESGGLVTEDYVDCASGSAVRLITVMDGGHVWYGGRKGWPTDDDPSSELSATDAVWEFFAAHPR